MTVALTFLVGRSKLFREGLKSLLSGSQFEVVGEADDVDQVHAPLGDQTPSIVLIDFSAEPEHAADDITHLRGVLPETKIVVLVENLYSQTLASCLGAGAHGRIALGGCCRSGTTDRTARIHGQIIDPKSSLGTGARSCPGHPRPCRTDVGATTSTRRAKKRRARDSVRSFVVDVRGRRVAISTG